MGLYHLLCEEAFQPAFHLASGCPTNAAFYRLLVAAQAWSPARVEEDQDRRLREVVAASAARFPYYAALLRERGVDAATFGGLADVARLPVLTKDHIQRGLEAGTLTQRRTRYWEASASSGSTGRRTVVYVDGETRAHQDAVRRLQWGWAGYRFGDPHLQTGMMLRRGPARRLKDLALRCAYRPAFGLDDATCDEALDALVTRRLPFLAGYASSLFALARRLLERGRRPLALRAAIAWGDQLFPRYRAAVEEAFGCRVHDHYGIGEGIQVAAQCERALGLHVAAPHCLVEVVDDAGEAVPRGVEGRLLLTRLNAGGQPLIRYDVGDVGRYLEAPCPCGRGLPALDRVLGRDADIIRTPGGRRLIVHFFTGIFQGVPEVAQFQALQEAPLRLRVRVVPARGFGPAVVERVRRAITAGCPGEALEVEVEVVPEIPALPSGKRRFVVAAPPAA